MNAGRPESETEQPGATRRGWRAGVIAVALAIGVVAWVASQDGDGGSPEQAPAEPAPPRVVTEAELREASMRLGHPIFWAGPVAGRELELIELDQGARVHYVPEETEAGPGSEGALTVSSYPMSDPAAAIASVAERPGEIIRHLPDGRTVVAGEEQPTNVYFASPDNSVQVEVFDPSAKRAMNLVLSGRVEPIG